MMPQSALGVKPFGLSIVLMLLVSGCGGGEGEVFKGPFGEVTGKVTFEGKPIPEGSQVVFQSTEKGYMAIGAVNASGEYALQYDGKPNVPGLTYQVTILPPAKTAASAAGTLDPAAGAKVTISKEAPPFPAKYSQPAKDRVFTVKEGKNTADFALTM
ncbi:MAG: hypothetical protein IAG10_14230 [Planctomycetaceae bacterium]|nr:hypothetical protein [Planctomycetaceae bacterium]